MFAWKKRLSKSIQQTDFDLLRSRVAPEMSNRDFNLECKRLIELGLIKEQPALKLKLGLTMRGRGVVEVLQEGDDD
jgi:hypothetical protein